MIDKHYIVNSEDAFREMKIAWNQLHDLACSKSPFLKWEWMNAWWQEYAGKINKAELNIVAFEDAGKLVGVLPLYKYVEGSGLKKLTRVGFIGDQIESSDYLDVLTTADYVQYFADELDTILTNLFKGVDLFFYRGVYRESVICKAYESLPEGEMQLNEFRVCPFLQLPDSFDDYLSTRSKNFRYNIRRRTKKLTNEDNAEFEVVDDPEKVVSGISEIFELHSQRAEQKNLDTKFVEDLRFNFHKSMAPEFAAAGLIKLFFLNVGEERIASLYCFDYNNTLYYFQGGFDPAWSKKSPGLVMMARTIRYAIENGFKVFDFMRGGEEYKFNWTNDTTHMYEVYRATSLNGKLYLKSLQLRSSVSSMIKKIT